MTFLSTLTLPFTPFTYHSRAGRATKYKLLPFFVAFCSPLAFALTYITRLRQRIWWFPSPYVAFFFYVGFFTYL